MKNSIRLVVLFPFSLLCALAFPCQTKADIFVKYEPVKVLLICGHAVDCDEAEAVLDGAAKIYKRQFGLDFVLLAKATIPHDMSGSIEDRLGKWIAISSELTAKFKPDVTIFSISTFPSSLPVVDYIEEQVAGAANGICRTEGAALFAKLLVNQESSIKVMAHELGHILGSDHTETGLMASSLMDVQLSQWFSLESIYSIQQCLELTRASNRAS